MRLIVEATKEMIFGAQRSSEWSIIDVRSSDAYIGWRSNCEIGGHIPYAKFFSAEWLESNWRDGNEQYEQYLELQLESQMISKDKKVIVYDENGTDADKVFEYLSEKGFENLFYYNLKNWDGDLFKYPNYKLMVPIWLVNELVKGNAKRYGFDTDYKIFEISWKDPSEQYLRTHIPGAVHIDSNEFEFPPKWIMVDDNELINFARNNGIKPDTTVILYGNDTLNMMAATKLAAVLRYIGVSKVFCMNGTIKNWVLAGYETEEGLVEKAPCEIETKKFVFDRKHAYHMAETKELLEHPEKGSVVDTRSWDRYIGEYSGYSYLDKAGRIPGTVWCMYPKNFLNPIDQVGNLEAMINIMEARGIDVSKPAAFFCGSASWGAAVNKLLLNMAGFENATIYEGGWCEWCQEPGNTWETGIPEEFKDYDPTRYQLPKHMTEESCHVM